MDVCVPKRMLLLNVGGRRGTRLVFEHGGLTVFTAAHVWNVAAGPGDPWQCEKGHPDMTIFRVGVIDVARAKDVQPDVVCVNAAISCCKAPAGNILFFVFPFVHRGNSRVS